MKEIPRTKDNEIRLTAFVDHYLTFTNYLRSYKTSFDILLNDVVESAHHVDYVAYPLLFMARHCMELGLKTNIKYFSRYSEKDDYTNGGGHDLEKLFAAFKMHVNDSFKTLKAKYGIDVEKDDKKSFNDLCCEVEKLNITFHLLDKDSDAFRYPVDKQHNASFKPGDRINLLDVNELLEKATTLFFHTSDVFSKYTDYADEIENYYQGAMYDQF